ncbi:hypothetical protein ACS0TY_016949 [Phlomoides rotata]
MDRSERKGKGKRKRAEKVETSRTGDQMKGKEEEVVAEAAPPPTEEEVDEFFAILRRMRVAVKYFEKEGINSKVAGGETLPTVEVAADAGGKTVVMNGGLDLNAVPEAESSLM